MSRQLLPQKIGQQCSTDCGVAVIAMAVGREYEVVESAFVAHGLHVAKIGKAPFMSNFKEVQSVLDSLGHKGRLRRFQSWAHISTPSIVKVRTSHKRHWHWVFATRMEPFGLLIHDPGRDLGYLEHMGENDARLPLETFDAHGCYLECSIQAPVIEGHAQ